MDNITTMAVEDVLARFHRDACYPDPMPLELSLAAAAVSKIILDQERIEIIRMIEADARQHDDAAAELRHDYEYAEIADEAWQHDCDAATLRSIADRIRARTPAEPVEEEPVF